MSNERPEEYEDFLAEISSVISERVEKISVEAGGHRGRGSGELLLPAMATEFLNSDKVIREWSDVFERIIEELR